MGTVARRCFAVNSPFVSAACARTFSRAFAMPIDINWLRKDRGGDPEKIRASEIQRGRDGKNVDRVIEIDEQWRKELFQMESLKKNMNDANKRVAEKKKKDKTDPCTEEVAEVTKYKQLIVESEKKVEEIAAQRDAALNLIGNMVHPSVPISNDEANNAVVRKWGTPSTLKVDGVTAGKLHHHQILKQLQGYEPERGTNVAGHRGYFLRGVGVRLNYALINYGLDFLNRKGYCPIQPPFFMKKSIMAETAELKDFEETLYRIPCAEEMPLDVKKADGKEGPKDNKEDLFLIATSEQPISAMHRGETLEPKELPYMYAGVSTCFRKEAGSHGKDTWGIFRIHQFEKIEQFCITNAEDSWAMHEKMIGACEEFYQSLELPYQVIAIVSGALNDAAAKKYDLEAWFPGYEAYRELVSCSNCTDYQSRHLEIRCGAKKQGDREKSYVHMLNATMVATQRCLCCILENYQTPEGVRVPRALQPYMGGVEFIPYPTAWDEAAAKKEKEEKEGKKAKDAKK
eukprot:GDKI01040387.1.p2 GENE.GDKI01040387.1~~GDKI01040387.1.p2  ORF type:complete len:514 (-),score=217.95 GDKI01040387.1:105-1646(-)